jgi:hypothetical protein
MKKSLLKTVLLAVSSFITLQSVQAQVNSTLFRKVSVSSDDAEQRVSTGAMDLTSSDLEIMTDGSNNQLIGIRFTNIELPAGAIIDSAFIQFTNVGDKNPVNGSAIIRAHRTANSGTFTTTVNNIGSRARTQDSVVWPGSTDATWGTANPNFKGPLQRTPDLKNVILEVLGLNNWQNGNAISFILNGTGVRNARSFNTSGGIHAPELIIYYTEPNYNTATFPLVQNGVWKLLDNGTVPPTNWKDTTFNDSAWMFKRGPLGYGLPVETNISFGNDSNNKYITTYFRSNFFMSNTANFDTLIFRVLRDDGAVVYINGVEAFRMNMPTGTITHTTLASTDVTGANETTYFEIRIPNTLVDGFNTIAVEVHQASASSPDKIFDISVGGQRVAMPIINFPVSPLSEWYYLDDGSDQDTAWRYPSFFVNRWQYGPAILGYGDPSATTLSFGPNASQKYPCYYFVKRVNITSVAALSDSIIFSIMRDDGAVVYVNGQEVFRTNMPNTTITFQTWASGTVDGANERTYFDFYVHKSVFVDGVNTIAITVHQDRGNSSDITFEMAVKEDPRTLNIISPSAGESVPAGQTYNINWYNVPSVGPITIELSTNNRATWTTVASNINPNTKPFVWNIPNINSSVSWLRITDSTGTYSDSVNIWLYPVPTPFNPCVDPLHIGCFTSVPQARNQVFKTPSTHQFQQIGRQGQSHTLGGTVGTNLDFTGFVTAGGSSKQGALGVNEETTPGGVSVFYISYDDTLGLWKRDSSGKIITSDPGVVQFTRNCSGGITPWGTIITAEETFNTGDVNGDGYQDVGWLVEYDPWTRRVIDYNNDGIRDKLWMMGRMSHENVVIANDSLTAYYAEDGGTSCVYKFVAFQKTRMDSGMLYVLQRNGATGSTGQWIQVPNSTQAQRNDARNIAGGLGGTSFNGPEDVEINPITGMIYFTSKNNSRIYRFSDDGMTVSNFEDFVGPASAVYTMNVEGGGTQNVQWSNGIDNLVFDNLGNLWAQQDGGQGHIWVIRPDHTPFAPKIDLFATTPAGSESSGLTFTPDYRFGFLSIMGASSTNTALAMDAAGNNIRFNQSNTLIIGRNEFLGPLAAVPVEFHSFDLQRMGKDGVNVLWSTASEINNSHFIVMRSTDGKNFVEVVKVNGAGNSTQVNSYRFADVDLKPATYYYRIKQVDFDGSFSYSTIKAINLNEDLKVNVNSVFPNPFNNEININLVLAVEGIVKITVTDINGRNVSQQTFDALEGSNDLQIATANLINGVYFVQIESQGEKYTYKLIK